MHRDGKPRRVFTAAEKAEIISLYTAGGIIQSQLAEKFETNQPSISRVIVAASGREKPRTAHIVPPVEAAPVPLRYVMPTVSPTLRESIARELQDCGLGPVLIKPSSLQNADLRFECEVVFGCVSFYEVQSILSFMKQIKRRKR